MSRWWGFVLGSAVILAAGAALAGSPEPGPEKHEEKSFRFFNVEIDGGYLGIVIKDLEGASRGARVEDVRDDSPAAKAGLKEGDVVVRFDGESVRSAEQLRRLVRETPPGREVAISVTRNGAEQKLTATLDKGHDRGFAEHGGPFAGGPPFPPGAPAPPSLPNFRFDPEDMPPGMGDFHRELRMGPHHVGRLGPRKIGVQYQEISGQLAKYFRLDGDEGILVVSVDENGPAAKAGVKAGDVIVKIGGKAVGDSEDMQREVGTLESGKETTLTVQRDGHGLDLKLMVGGKKPAPDPKSTT